MYTQTRLEHWPRTQDGRVEFIDTNDALLYAAFVWDDMELCPQLGAQLNNLRQQYDHLKGQARVDLDKLSDLAFAIQFTREALEETEDLQARARNFTGP